MVSRNSLKTPWDWWTNYWFSPAPLFNLAICRILIVGFQLIRFITNNYLGSLVEYSTLPNFLYEPLPVLKLLLFGLDYRPSLIFTVAVFALTIIAGIFGLVGLFTRVNLILFALGNIFIQAYLYSFRDFHHSEALVMISLLIIALSPSGGVLSIDDLRRRIYVNQKQEKFKQFDIKEENTTLAKWPLLLTQWIFAIIYLDSGMSKISKGGIDWTNGYTLQYYLWQDGLIWDRSFGIWLAQQHTLAILSSWVAILFELTFFLVLIFPKLVWFYIPLGISFHTGIYIAQKAPFLKYIPSYSVFIPWAAIAKSLSRSKTLEIIYDSENPKDKRLMTIFCYFDLFNCLKFSDLETNWPSLAEKYPEFTFEDYQKDFYIQLPNYSLRKGVLAFREICKRLPLFWLLLPIFSLPKNSSISQSIYRLITQKKIR